MKKVAMVTDGWRRLITYSWMDGIMGQAKARGIDLTIYQFNANGNWSKDKKHNNGEYNIYELPHYGDYDGIVFDCSNMTDQKQINKTVDLLRSYDVPVVSISYAVEGFYYVGNDNKRLFRELLDHLHDVHHCKSYVFAGGPDYNFENQMRFEAFREAMADYGIPLTDDMYMFGDFDYDTGTRYMEEWIAAGKPFPECFVCANDNIAAGLCASATDHGYRIPGDFMVTGFDNLDKAAYYNPQITTVEHNRGGIGMAALDVLADLWEGKEVAPFTFLHSEVIPGESCGCPNSGRVDYRNYVKWQIDYSVKQDHDEEETVILESKLNDCKTLDSLFEEFSDYVENKDCDGIYIVVPKGLFVAKHHTHFPTEGYDRDELVVGYASEGHKRLGELKTIVDLEQHMTHEDGLHSYVFSPLHFRDEVAGFTVLKEPRFLYNQSDIYNLIHVFVQQLENLFKQLKLENAHAQMKEIYNRDQLTGLFNRLAYTEMILPKYEGFCRDNIVCAMIFFDVDRFKQINDTYGHEFGDQVLKTIADTLMKHKPDSGYAYRFGGDEFVVFFPGADEDRVNRFIQKVTVDLRRRKIEISSGVILTEPGSGKSLDAYLKEADQKMYEIKTERKKHERKCVFYKGMDISSLPEHLDGGEHFYAADGRELDALDLLEENHVNSIRIRIWNEPSNVPESKGYCDLAHTLWMAKRIREKGMHFYLDFHYSDYWADPGQQRKPKAWENLSFDELVTAVHDFTAEVLSELAKIDCLPDMIQVGNEIRSGMLFPDGEVPAYDRLAKLVNAGIRAVREASPDITVMIHLDQGGRYYYLKEWFDAVFAAGMEPIDAIGISFYSFWHGTFMDLRDSMTQLIERYHVPVYVVETAHPWRQCEKEHVSKDLMETAGLPAGIAEQKRSLELVMQIAAEVSGNLPTGVYYWEPLCTPGKDYGSWDENMGMLDESGKALAGFETYRDFDPEHPPIAELDSYIEKLYEVDESKLPPAGTNLVPNGDFAEGTKGWWLEKDPKEVVVEERENEIYISAKCNFTFRLFREIQIAQAGKYRLSVEYRGTNTTGVKVALFLKEITCNGEEYHSLDIFPSDVRFVPHMMEELALPAGTVQLGIAVEAPPIFGRIKNIRLVKVE